VSIIIPVFNRWDSLPACVESIRQQSYGPIEIIIVDDGSTTPRPVELRHMSESLRVVELPRNFGPGHARNRGYLESHGEFLHFLDSDTTLPHAKLVTSAVAFLREHPNAGAVGGEIPVPDGREPSGAVLGRGIGLLGRTYYVSLQGGNEHEDDAMMPCDYLASCNLFLPRAVFEAVGGFDPYFGFGAEDVELCRRIGRAGRGLYISQRCAVFHHYSPAGRSRHLNYRYDLTRLREVFKSESLAARLLFSIVTALRIVAFYPLLPIKLACYVAMRRPIRSGHFDSGFFLAKAFVRAIRELPHTLKRRGLDFLAPDEIERFERSITEATWLL
jgi:GT2 family glycosyltransferase